MNSAAEQYAFDHHPDLADLATGNLRSNAVTRSIVKKAFDAGLDHAARRMDLRYEVERADAGPHPTAYNEGRLDALDIAEQLIRKEQTE